MRSISISDHVPRFALLSVGHICSMVRMILVFCTCFYSGSPEEKDSGLVYSFFASLKAALYGEQRKESRNSR